MGPGLKPRRPVFSQRDSCIYAKTKPQINCATDQCLCFCSTTTTIPPKFQASSHSQSLMAVRPGLCVTWSETPKTGFLTILIKSTTATNTPHFNMIKKGKMMNCFNKFLMDTVLAIKKLTCVTKVCYFTHTLGE